METHISRGLWNYPFIVLLSVCFISASSLTLGGEVPAKEVSQDLEENEVSSMTRRVPNYAALHCVPELNCLCEGLPHDTDDDDSYEIISCFFNGVWNSSFDAIPPTRALVLRCYGEMDTCDLSDKSFENLANSLSQLTIIHCRIGIFPTDTFSRLLRLQQLLLDSTGLDGRRLSAIGGIPTNASVKIVSNTNIRILDSESFGRRKCNVSKLDLSFNGIQEVGNDTFAMFPSLNKILLGNNNISVVNDDALVGLDQLTELNIRFNPGPLADGKCIFKPTPSLKKLDISHCALRNITTLKCTLLPYLTILLINGNHLKELPDSAFEFMPNVKTIDVSNNYLTNINTGALKGGLNNLSVVNLSRNHIQGLPYYLFQPAPNVISVNVSHNRLSVIQTGTFSGLPLLESVDLSVNHLHTVQQFGFVAADRLNLIDLRYNNFIEFPDNLISPFVSEPPHIPMSVLLDGNPFTCGCAKMFGIRTGQFTENFPFLHLADKELWSCLAPPPAANELMMSVAVENFWCPYEDETCRPGACECYRRDFDKARIYFCHKNNLKELPDIPANTAIFDCTGCLVAEQDTLGPGTLRPSSTLDVLVLREIGLRQILPGALDGYTNLQQLDLVGNSLSDIEDTLLTNLTNLYKVDLSNNQIASMDNQTFETNVDLSTIHLHSNSLQTLEDGIFNYSLNLKLLTLHDNPLVCNCSLFWLKQWLQSNLDLVSQIYEVMCYVNSSDADMYPLIQVADQDFGCDSPDIHTLTIEEYTIVIITSTLTVVFLLISAVMFRHRRAIRVILYTRYGFHLMHGDDDDDVIKEEERWEFDAYIAYSDADVEFVLQRLLPILEWEDANPRYKVCIRHRDFLPGACIATTIVTSLDASRRSIVLLSRDFLRDEWRLLEFKTAHQRVLKDKRNNNLILIFLEDIANDEMDEDMGYYVTANAYLSSVDRLFREKLLYEMPKHPLTDINGAIENKNP